MLIDQITNPRIRFGVLRKAAQGKEMEDLATKAFFYVIEHYNAFDCQKEKILDEIIQSCPSIADSINGERVLESFKRFFQESERRREIIITEELCWVEKYVKDSSVITQIKKLIYRKLLSASSHQDYQRKTIDLSVEDELEIVREVLQERSVGSKRKMEIAKEFGEPSEAFTRNYWKKLLYDRHYEKAESLGNFPDVALDIIVENINNGYLLDALDVAERFLPERKGEVEGIINAFV